MHRVSAGISYKTRPDEDDGFGHRREEEDEARVLTEEMQRNLDEAQSRSYEVERKLDRVLSEYMKLLKKKCDACSSS